jgi:hypothetical protein
MRHAINARVDGRGAERWTYVGCGDFVSVVFEVLLEGSEVVSGGFHAGEEGGEGLGEVGAFAAVLHRSRRGSVSSIGVAGDTQSDSGAKQRVL